MNFDQTARQLCANAIGNYIITYLDCLSDEAIAHMTELCAVQLLRRIKEILDDEALDDPTCFQRIDAIVSCLLYTSPSPRDCS